MIVIDGTATRTLRGRFFATDHDDDADDKRRLFGAGYTALALAVVYRAVQEADAGDTCAMDWLLNSDLCEALLDLAGLDADRVRCGMSGKFAPVQ